MVIELIAAVCAGFAAAGVVMALRKLTGAFTARWMVPAAVGAGILGFTVWSEYAWYDRTTSALPEGVSILNASESRTFYRPWTYLFPLRDRFTAVDRAAVRRNDAVPDQRMAEILTIGRYGQRGRRPVLVDCAAPSFTDLVQGVDFKDDGTVENADWRPLAGDDPLIPAVCGAE